jgi:eukaryotic-like serine/threonine-protein kinase
MADSAPFDRNEPRLEPTQPTGKPPATDEDDETGLDKLPPPLAGLDIATAYAETRPPSAGPRDSAPAPRLPGYEILGELGQGGMGKVYRARQLSLDRLVAIKMIRAGDLADTDELERFQREAHAVAQLQHANVVQVFEIGAHDGRPFLVMELVEGGSLNRRVQGKPLPPRTAAALVETLARAMDVVHKQGLLHRDLKPANILLQESGLRNQESGTTRRIPADPCLLTPDSWIPKITDFGLVKRLADAEQGVTPSQAVIGTPSYMAPEQASGQTRTLGPAADQYALGAILYELLTGRPPFVGVTSLETLIHVMADDPLPPRRLQPGVPRDLETVCLQCLRKHPGERYASTLALAEDLHRFLDGAPVHARPIGLWERGWKWARRSPWVAGLSAMLVLVVVLAFVLVTWMWRDAVSAGEAEEKAHAATAEALRESQANLYFDRIGRSDLEWLANNPVRAEAILDRCPVELRRIEWDLLKRRCHDDVLTFVAAQPQVNCVAFSADGRLATGGGDMMRNDLPASVRVWDPGSGACLLHLKGEHTGTITGIAFSPDGERLATASMRVDISGLLVGKHAVYRGEVVLWDLKNEKPLQRFAGQGSVAFDPHGKTLAIPQGSQGVVLWDIATGQKIKHIGADSGRVICLAFSRDGKQLVTVTDETKGFVMPGKYDRVVRRWDVATGTMDRLIGRAGQTGYNLALSHDGRRLAVTADARLRMWDLGSGAEPQEFIGHNNDLSDVQFSPDDAWLATSSRDRTVKIWDVARVEEVQTLRGHHDQVAGVAFAPPGALGQQRLASVGFDGLAKVWDLWAGSARWTLRAHPGIMAALALSADSSRLATASASDGLVKVWNTQTHQPQYALRCPETVRVAFNPRGTLLAAFGGSPFNVKKPGVVRLWNLADGRALDSTPRHPMIVYALAFSPDGRFLVSASGDQGKGTLGAISLWDLTEGHEVPSFRPPSDLGHVSNIAYSPDASLLALASMKDGVWLCDAQTGREVGRFRGKRFYRVAFDRTGARLAAGSAGDGWITVWDVPGGKEAASWQAHDGWVTALAFTADGDRLLSASYNELGTRGDIKVWEVRHGREVLRLPGQLHLALSEDGRRLAANADGELAGPATVTVWDATSALPPPP